MEDEDLTKSEEEVEVPSAAADSSPIGTYTAGMSWNPVEKVIFERRSTRAFKPQPLPDGMIRRILEAGRFAPSAGNAQPWKFIVVKNPEIIAEMEKDAFNFAKRIMSLLDYTRSRLRRFFTRGLSKFVIRHMLSLLAPEPFLVFKRVAEGKIGVFFNAPTLILIFIDTRGPGDPRVDSGIAGQNMVLAAHSMGASTCWIGMVKLLTHPLAGNVSRKWKKFFGIKYPYELNNTIALGWPKRKFDKAVPREVQQVPWYEGGMDAPPRIDRQGGEK
jgi:nitroreductase